MKKWRHTRGLPEWLMAGSLVLLFLFLAYWLKNVYAAERQSLQKETSLLFANAMRGMEEEIMETIFRAPLRQISGDTAAKSVVTGNAVFSKTIIRTRSEIESEDTSIQITIHTPDHLPGTADTLIEWATDTFLTRSIPDLPAPTVRDTGRAFSLLLALDQKDSLRFDLDVEYSDSTLQSLISRRFEAGLQSHDLPLTYRIVRQSEPVRGLRSETYSNWMNGSQYAVELTHYQWLIAKRMIPETLFAFGLFGWIALSFSLVYRNWRNQRRLAQMKNEFIQNITHELQTPVTTVTLAMEALADFDVLKNPERAREYLHLSKQSLARLSSLIDRVLELSILEKSETPLRRNPVNLTNLVGEVLNTLKPRFESLSASVRRLGDERDFWVKGDATHLAGVLYNLLDNALKYSDGPPEIDLELSATGGMVRLAVRDRGVGIPAAYRTKIFGQFFRVPTGEMHNVKGHGLGLSYVAGVVRNLGGTILVESPPDGGTRFVIQFPETKT
ncbi:MAG: sensor histidine kinase [Bacteroidetes bacterium]|nr:MAG: sensor histidine kinase [Bacteroidota bacterium]